MDPLLSVMVLFDHISSFLWVLVNKTWMSIQVSKYSFW